MKKLLLTVLVISGIGSCAIASDVKKICEDKCRADFAEDRDSVAYEKCMKRCKKIKI